MRRTIVQRLYRDSYAATTPTIGNTVVKPASMCLICTSAQTTAAIVGALIHTGSGVRWCGSSWGGRNRTNAVPTLIVASTVIQKTASPVGGTCAMASPQMQ